MASLKVVTYENIEGKQHVGALHGDNNVVDLSSVSANMLEFLGNLEENSLKALKILSSGGAQFPLSSVKLVAPIPRPDKVVCIGLNYSDHAAESGMAIPAEPVVFSKFSSVVVGPNSPIVLPKVSVEVDYEVELVVVIGKKTKNVSEADALDHVAGYTVGNDVSARDWQLRKPGGQWLLGKTCDTFAPIGPSILINPKYVPGAPSFDPNNISLKCTLNDQVVQNGSTKNFIFNVQTVVSYVSKIVTLVPGDIIFTGTPPGVGFARKPPLFMKAGDVVVCEIDCIGKLENPVVADV